MAAVRIEMRAGDIGHLACDGFFQQRQRIHAFRQLGPDKQAALRYGMRTAVREKAEAIQHGMKLFAVGGNDLLDMLKITAAANIGIYHGLCQVICVGIHSLLGHRHRT